MGYCQFCVSAHVLSMSVQVATRFYCFLLHLKVTKINCPYVCIMCIALSVYSCLTFSVQINKKLCQLEYNDKNLDNYQVCLINKVITTLLNLRRIPDCKSLRLSEVFFRVKFRVHPVVHGAYLIFTSTVTDYYLRGLHSQTALLVTFCFGAHWSVVKQFTHNIPTSY